MDFWIGFLNGGFAAIIAHGAICLIKEYRDKTKSQVIINPDPPVRRRPKPTPKPDYLRLDDAQRKAKGIGPRL